MRKLLLCCVLLIGCTLLLVGTRRGSRASTPPPTTVYSYVDLEDVPVAQASFIQSINQWISHNDLRGMVTRLKDVIETDPNVRWSDIDAVRIYNEYVGNSGAPKGSLRHMTSRENFILSDLTNLPSDLPSLLTPDETLALNAQRLAVPAVEEMPPVEIEELDFTGTYTVESDEFDFTVTFS